MKQGTTSILFGVHSPVHSTLVLISWIRLYHEMPKPWQITCIYLHDIGHIGKNYLDDVDEKRKHWLLGATIAEKLFGKKGYNLCAGHCHSSGLTSELMKPNKYSWYIAPRIWLLSNTIIEPKVAMGYSKWQSVIKFKQQVKDSIESGEYRSSHDMYLERCRK